MPRAIIGQRGTLLVVTSGCLRVKRVIFITVRTMWKRFPVNWLLPEDSLLRLSAPKRGGVNKWKKWRPNWRDDVEGLWFDSIVLLQRRTYHRNYDLLLLNDRSNLCSQLLDFSSSALSSKFLKSIPFPSNLQNRSDRCTLLSDCGPSTAQTYNHWYIDPPIILESTSTE